MGFPAFEVNITSDITDVQKLIRTLAAVEKYQIPKIIKASTKRMERDIKKSIRTGSRSGEHYRGLPNKSSAPGEAPKTQTGKLASSIKSWAKNNPKQGMAEGAVGSTSFVGLWMEHGTKARENNMGISPRPFLQPAITREIPNIVDDIIDALR